MTHLFLICMASPQEKDPQTAMYQTLGMFAMIIAIFYFLILRPQQKRQKEKQRMLDTLKKGDKVVTAGGMHGTVAGLDDKTVLLQVSDNVKMKFERSAVTTVLKEGEPETKEGKKEVGNGTHRT